MVDNHFLDPPVNAETVVLVHHIISDGEIRKAPDLPGAAAVGFFSPLPAFFRSKDIRLRDEHKLLQRIFKSPADISPGDHDLVRGDLTVRILTEKSRKPFFYEILRKSFSSRPRSGQQHHPIMIFPVILQIIDQHRKLVVVGADRSHGH